jgi:hypothetical protein
MIILMAGLQASSFNIASILSAFKFRDSLSLALWPLALLVILVTFALLCMLDDVD